MKKQLSPSPTTPATITIPGRALQSGFCLYVHEILNVQNQAIAYYIGMTGDNHYPSARSPFHRLAGHFDRSGGSTQRQLGNALESQLGSHALEDLTIKMHYYHITGFAPIEGATNKKGPNHFTAPQFANKLTAYKRRRKQVLGLENYIIALFRSRNILLLNKTTTSATRPMDDDLMGIVLDIDKRFLSDQ